MPKVAQKSMNEDYSAVTFAFSNGETVVVEMESFNEETFAHLAAAGVSSKLGDTYAGLGESIPKAVEALKRSLTDLLEGKWTTRTAGSGPRVALLVEALVRVSEDSGSPRSLEECEAVIEELDDDTKKELRASEAIKLAMATIKLEKTQADASKAKESGAETLAVAALFATS